MASIRILMGVTSTVVLLNFLQCVSSLQYKELKQRLKDGLQDYDPNLIPVYNLSEPLEVSMLFYIKTLVEVKEKDNSIRAVVYMVVEWKDEMFEKEILKSLCVDQDCGNDNRQHFALESKTIWIPDISLLNSRTNIDLRTETNVKMSYFGQGVWSRNGVFETFCSIESQKYPFDEQECYYEFGPGFSSLGLVTINTGNLDIILDYYEQNGGWELQSGTTYIYQLNRIRYVMRLKRRSTLILLSMVIPTTLISLTGTLCFILPTESGERLTLVISIALAIIIYLTITQSYLPRSVTSISYFEMLLSAEMALCLFYVVMTVISIYIYYRPRKFIFGENYAFSQMAGLVKNRKTKPTHQDGTRNVPLNHDNIEGNFDLSQNSQTNIDMKGIRSTTKVTYVISWKEVSRFMDKLCFFVSLTVNIVGFVCFLVMALRYYIKPFLHKSLLYLHDTL